MEGYPQDPYAYLPPGYGGGKSKFHNIEGILPILLLVVIGVFVLQVLDVIPCIIPIGCGEGYTVAVVGQASPYVEQALTGKEARYAKIKYAQSFTPDIINSKMLSKFDIVIIQNWPYFDLNAREAIRSYVDGGGKLVIVKDAGTRAPNYPNVYGWDWPRGQGIPSPVSLRGEYTGELHIDAGSEIRIVNIDHPIVQGIKIKNAYLARPDSIVEVVPEGDTIAFMMVAGGTTTPAIVIGGSGLGTVIYFSYDPGLTPEILIPTVQYLGG